MSIKNTRLIFLASALILTCFFRILSAPGETLPKNRDLKFEATIVREVQARDNVQVVAIGDLRAWAPLYPKFEVGDRVIVEGYVDENGNIYKPRVAKIGTRPVVLSKVSQLRQKISANLSGYLPQNEAALVLGAVLGLDTMSEVFKQELIKTGTIHVVVVSGQNLMILVGVVMAFTRYIGRRQSLALSLIAVLGYSLIAGFEPPVIRASLLVLASVAGIYFGREVNAVWSLFLAGVLILLVWPQAIFEISFQLTFAASLGIITLGQKLSRTFGRVPIVGVNGAVAVSAFLFTLPIIVFHFGRVSLLSPLVNILVAEAVLPIMVLGFAISAASLIFAPLASVVSLLVYPVAYLFVQVVHIFAAINVGQVSAGQGNLWFVAICYLLLAFVYLSWNNKPGKERR